MPQIVPAAQRALQVFEAFARERRPLTNAELAQMLDLAGSSCSDLLHTLKEAGYLLRMPKARQLYPSTRLADLAQRFGATDPFRVFISEALEILSRRSGESALCGYLEDTRLKIYACQESQRALRYVLQPGTVVDVHTTALGKAVLGALPRPERDALIDRLPMTPASPTSIRDREVLRAEIERCLPQGWFTANEEGGEGVAAIGIAGEISGRLAALSIVGPTARLEKNLDAYVSVLLEARRDFF
jgi:DNA-binding IclR family transcriptional regulator